MRTSEAAQMAGVNVQTLRFYERRGLLPDPPRRNSGYREYGPNTVNLVRFIKWTQGMGFSLTEVDRLLDVALTGDSAACRDGWTFVDDKIAELERKIVDLTTMRDSLRELLATYAQSAGERTWPVVDAADEPSR